MDGDGGVDGTTQAKVSHERGEASEMEKVGVGEENGVDFGDLSGIREQNNIRVAGHTWLSRISG